MGRMVQTKRARPHPLSLTRKRVARRHPVVKSSTARIGIQVIQTVPQALWIKNSMMVDVVLH